MPRCYAPPLIGGGIKRCFCLTFVCLTSVVYIGPKSRTERPRKTKIGTEVPHVTCDSDTTFKVKRSKVKVTRPLCSPPCWRVSAAAAVGMRTCWPWETAATSATLPSARRRKVHGTHEGKEGRGHIVAAARLQLVKHVSLMLYAKFDGNF